MWSFRRGSLRGGLGGRGRECLARGGGEGGEDGAVGVYQVEDVVGDAPGGRLREGLEEGGFEGVDVGVLAVGRDAGNAEGAGGGFVLAFE